MFALFIVSRTAGLPGYHESWDRIGFASLVLEGLSVAIAAANLALGRMDVRSSRIAETHARIERGVALESTAVSVPCSPSPQIAGAVTLGSRDRPRRSR